MGQQSSTDQEIPSKHKTNNKGDGITYDVFQGERIYLNNGNVTFKQLGMETVFESTEEAKGTLNGQKWKQQMKSMKAEFSTKKRSFFTTESNIALQQQLDLATAQELVSFPSGLDQKVNEEQYCRPISTSASQANQYKSGSLRNVPQFRAKLLSQSKTAHNDLTKQITLRNLQQIGELKSSLKTLTSLYAKNEFMAENRKLHPGLQQYNSKYRTSQVNSTASNTELERANTSQDVRLYHPASSALFNESTIKRGSDVRTVERTVEFNESTVRRRSDGRNDSISMTSGIFDALEPLEPHPQKVGNYKAQIKETIGPKLYRQTTGNNRIISRKLRDQPLRFDDANQHNLQEVEKGMMMETNTVVLKPLTMPQRTQSDKDFLRKSAQMIVPKIRDEAEIAESHHDDNLSKLAIDYELHLTNQKRIQNLMALIGGNKKSSQGQNLENTSNFDADYQRDTQLPKINTRRQDGEEVGPFSERAYNFLCPSTKASLKLKNTTDFNNSIDFPSQQNGSMEILLELCEKGSQNVKKRNFLKRDTASHNSQQFVQFQDLKTEADYQRIMSPKVQLGGKILIKHQQRICRLLKSTDSGANLKYPQYKKVRQKLFDNNIIHQRFNTQRDSDQSSELSLGRRSQFQKQSLCENEAINVEEYQIVEFKSPRPQTDQSSNQIKVLKPINFKSVDSSKDKHTRTSSLQFKTGLTFVVTNGKAQPTLKYINKNMTPYMHAQSHNSVKQKPSISRASLRSNQGLVQVSKAKSKQLKGAKMKRGNISLVNSFVPRTSQESRKKGIIQGEEQDDSDISIMGGREIETLQDIQEENAQLKDQLLNQIAIFQQYLKVAILQNADRTREANREHQRGENIEAKSYGARFNSTEDHIFKRDRDFQFDWPPILAEQIKKKVQRRHTTMITKKPKVTFVSKNEKKIQDSQMEIVQAEYVVQNLKSTKSLLDQEKKGSAKSRRSTICSRKSSRSSSAMKNKPEFCSQVILQKQSAAETLKTSSTMHGGEKLAASFLTRSCKFSRQTMRSYEHLQSARGETTHEASHIAHQKWMNKIEKLWTKLNAQRNDEIVRMQDEIRMNKERIQQLTRENLFELDVNCHDQKVLLKVRGKTNKVQNRLKNGIEQSRIQLLQKRVREEIDRKREFDTWGFHSHIIEFRLKVRMTEDIVDCAQRLAVKADSKTQNELNLLTMMRDRLYDDLRYFIQKREKRNWRHWEGGFPYKPSLENRDLTLQKAQGRIESHLQMIAFLEPMYIQLLRDIPPYNKINSEMIMFCTGIFGNQGWLQLFQLKLLRKQQEAEQHKKEYMPPVDYIKRMIVDPYALQINTDAYDDFVNETKKKEATSPSSWHICKPDNANQNTQENIFIQEFDAVLSTSALTLGETQEKSNNQDNQNPQDIQKMMTQSASKQANRFAGGDVVEHIKDQAVQRENSDLKAQRAQQLANSTWIQVLEKEKQEKAGREAIERKNRAARLAILFEEEDVLSQDDEDLLDAGAARRDVANYIDKIETHLQVEKRILEAWHQKDTNEGNVVPVMKLTKISSTQIVK